MIDKQRIVKQGKSSKSIADVFLAKNAIKFVLAGFGHGRRAFV